MAVEVKIPTILRTYTKGERTVAATGATLAQILENLNGSHPGIAERLVQEDNLLKFINIYVNDEDVRYLDGLATVIADKSTITIIPAVAGG